MINCQDVSLTVNNQKLFEHFNLEINEGGKVLILGPSGSGKTSLVHMLLGLKLPSHGCIEINSRLMQGKCIWDLRTLIAYADQDASLGQGKVIEILEELFYIKSLAGLCIDKETWKNYLSLLLLNDSILEKEINTLSGGERQRLALAVVIALNRPIWILDEPTASLDKAMKERVIRLVTAEKKRTIIIISHDEQWQAVPGLKKIRVESLS